MRYVVIDGRAVSSMDDVHSAFAEALDFPGYYGRNLDALHDCLTEAAGPVTVVVLEADALREKLGESFSRLLLVLGDCEEEKGGLSVYM